MKKLLILVATLGLATTALAESEFTQDAEYRVRGAVTQGTHMENDKSENAIKHRFKLSNTYKANDSVSAQLTLTHNAGWGADNVFLNGTSNGTTIETDRSSTNPNNATNDDLAQNTSILVNEAYVTWALNDQFTLKMGRGSFEGGAGTSTAINDFQDVMTAFDGVAGIYETDFARVIGYLIKFADFNEDNVITPRNDAEANTVGVTADLKFAPEIFEFFNVGINQVKRDQYFVTGVPIAAESYIKYNVGFKANFAEMFHLRAAYSANSGERTTDDKSIDGDISSSMMDLEAGIHMEDMMNFKFSIGYHQDSGTSDSADSKGDDESYNSYYYDVHRYAGLMDVVSWGNLTYISAKASIEPMENFTVGAQYHIFTATEKEGKTRFYNAKNINDNLNAVTGSINPVSKTKDDIGSEIDVYATHKYDNGLSLTARYGLFMIGDRIEDAYKSVGFEAEDNQTFFLEGTFTF